MTKIDTAESLKLLNGSSRAVSLRIRHRDFFLELAEMADEQLRGPRQVEFFDLLEAEHDNMRAALEWSFSHGDSQEAVRLAIALVHMWLYRGHSEEGMYWLLKAIEAGQQVPAEMRARLHISTAWLARDLGQQEALRDHAEKGLTLAREANDKPAIVRGLCVLSRSIWREQGTEAIRPMVEEALAIAEEIGDKRQIGAVLMQMGTDQEGLGLGREPLERALALQREVGDRNFEGWVLGALTWMIEDVSLREEYWNETLGIALETKDEAMRAYAVEGLGWFHAFRGDGTKARVLFEDAIQHFRVLGHNGLLCWMLGDAAGLAQMQGRFPESIAMLQEVLRLNKKRSGQGVWAHLDLAKALQSTGNHAAAIVAVEEAKGLANTLQAPKMQGDALTTEAEVALAEGDLIGSRAAVTEAISLLRPLGKQRSLREALAVSAALSKTEGDWDGALAVLEEMVELADESYWQASIIGRRGDAHRRKGDLESAIADIRSAFDLSIKNDHLPGEMDSLWWVAGLKIAQGGSAVAATLFGAMEKLREAYEFAPHRSQRLLYETDLAALWDSADGEVIDGAWAKGRAMSKEEAIELARVSLADAP
ncbi:MAG: hypothetical protein ABIS18_01480 [Actinomycetota bacterium]